MNRMLSAPAVLALVLALGGCASPLPSANALLDLITPYRIDIVQGNVVTREQAEQLRVGMSRNQVRDLLGSPLLTDIFHGERWDYLFTFRRQGNEPQRRAVMLRFKGDVLDTIEAPDLPSEREFIASIGGRKPLGSAPVLELTEEQRKALPVPARPAAAATEPVGPLREYPPLEPS